MPQIGRWVFDEVMSIVESERTLRIFMNLSAKPQRRAAADAYRERLRGSNIAPGRISFEITETAAISDLGSARNWTRRLKDLGCLIALDDFGVGFCSFGYLRALAVDYIKLDRSFVRDLDTNATNRALVQAVNTVANAGQVSDRGGRGERSARGRPARDRRRSRPRLPLGNPGRARSDASEHREVRSIHGNPLD
jgi:EAL domain-containing protein (putative c-di-GMP-specific phosphodiesterase class I)